MEAIMRLQVGVWALVIAVIFLAGFCILLRIKLRKNEKALNAASGELATSRAVLETERLRLTKLLESIGEGVCVIGRNWTVVLWNKAAVQVAGWPADEVLERNLRSVIKILRERDREENVDFIEEAMVHGETRMIEENTVMISKEGREIPVVITASPVSDDNKKVTGAIVVFRDISKEREAQMLRSDFAYASHQLRTPVGRALWSLEAARGEKDAKSLRQGIDAAYLSMLSIHKLVNQLMEVSEIDQGVVVAKMAEIKIGEVFGEVIERFKNEAEAKRVSVILRPVPAGAVVVSDRRLLKRIFSEIMDNSVTYARDGGEVAIAVEFQKEGLLVEIKDSGIGIAEEEEPLVFTKFFRGSNFDDTEIAGAGLGLFIARGYVKLLNGKIWFKSEANKGTSFFVLLPA